MYVKSVDHNIWLFYNNHQTEYCQIQSSSNELTEPLLISEPSIVHMPCDKTITYANNQLYSSSCAQHRIIVRSNIVSKFQQLTSRIVPLRDMTRTLISNYQQQTVESIEELSTVFVSKKIMDILVYGLGILFTIVLAVISCIGNYLIYKVHKPVRKLKNRIDEIFTV